MIDKIELTLIEKIENSDTTSDFQILENEVERFEIKELIKIGEKENYKQSFTFKVNTNDLKHRPKN